MEVLSFFARFEREGFLIGYFDVAQNLTDF